uniref:Uncharacterized protein n=1 Tax=Anopheles coluzzii TaxID=1518534 RepID=A0A8W7PB61_ANOCL
MSKQGGAGRRKRGTEGSVKRKNGATKKSHEPRYDRGQSRFQEVDKVDSSRPEKKKRPVIKGKNKKKKQKEGERKRQRSPCPGNSPGGPNGGIWRAPGHGTPPLMPPQAAAAAASALNGVGRIGTWPAAAARAAPGGEPCPIPIADGDPGEPLPFRPPGCEPLSLSSWSMSSMSTIESSSSSWFESLCGVSVCRSGSRFRSELPSCWDRGEEELVVWEDRLAGSMSLDGEVPGRVVVVTVVSAVVIAWCSSAAPCGGPCTISGLSGVSEGGVGVVVVGVPEVMMAWCAFGVLGRVSASRDATLKLLIRELLFCCMGTVGLVIAIRTGVTVIPDDFSMKICTELHRWPGCGFVTIPTGPTIDPSNHLRNPTN